ncbi:unnamed protein product [Pedinophyceae sp. YPF-701]|nr:unnamed protein product [Pedinophyceae sp. YPF-701]
MACGGCAMPSLARRTGRATAAGRAVSGGCGAVVRPGAHGHALRPSSVVALRRELRLRAQARDAELSSSETSPAETPREAAAGGEPSQGPRPAPKEQAGSRLPGLAAGTALLSGAGIMGTGFDVSGPGSYAEAILVLCAIVGIHEFGHFSAARSLGIHVNKFSIGFGPILAAFEKDNVEYSLRAFPLGGFVGFPDEDPDSEFEPDDPDLMKNRPVLDRFIVTSAGIVANVILAWSVLFAQFEVMGTPDVTYKPGVLVAQTTETSLARQAGIQPGDIITKIGSYNVGASEAAVNEVVQTIRDYAGRDLNVEYLRGGAPGSLVLRPDPAVGRIGVQLGPNADVKRVPAPSPLAAANAATEQTWKLTRTIANGLAMLFSNFSQSAQQLSGPVAIVAAGADIARADSSGLAQFCAVVSLNLAVVNALPLPGLDGGYMALQAAEVLRGKKLPNEVERGIMGTGFLMLMTAGLALIARDTANLIQ